MATILSAKFDQLELSFHVVRREAGTFIVKRVSDVELNMVIVSTFGSCGIAVKLLKSNINVNCTWPVVSLNV